MARLKLKRGTAQNFRSIGHIPITINYEKLGNLTLVHSELNGSGKSTLFVQLIIYALKGKAYNAKSKIGNLVNLKNNKHSIVELEFEYGKDTYVVKRGQKPKVFELIKNNTLLPTAIDYQRQLDELIGTDLSFDMLVNSIILSPSRYTPFRIQTKKQREEFLDYIFRTHVYSPMLQENKLDIKNSKVKLDSISNDIQHINQLIESKENAIEKFNNTKDNIADDIILKLEILDKQKSDIDKQILGLDNSCLQTKENINTIISEIQGKYNQFNTDVNNVLLIQRNKLNIVKLDSCNTCNQEIESTLKNRIKSEVNEELKSIAPTQKIVLMLKDQLLELNKKKELINNSVNQYIKDTNTLTSKLNVVKSQIDAFNNQLKFQDDKFQETIIKYTEELRILKKDIELSKDEELSILTSASIISKGNDFLSQVNIRTEIMSNYIPYINSMLNNYLKEMEFFIEVTIDDNYNIIVTSASKEGLSIHDLSDGERSKIDLAFILVWKRIQDQITQDLMNVFILDETLSNFSPQSVKDFLKLIKTVLPDHKVIVILQHPNEFIESFDSIIEIKIEDDFTFIEEDISINDLAIPNNIYNL